MASEIWSAFSALLLALTGANMSDIDAERSARTDMEEAAIDEREAEQISLEHVVIIRVPRTSRTASPSDGRRDDGTAKCLPSSSLIGMRVSRSGSLDLLTSDGWYRAHMSDGCDARQFHSGFYIEKAGDGLFCSGREELRARSGAMCQIERFTRY